MSNYSERRIMKSTGNEARVSRAREWLVELTKGECPQATKIISAFAFYSTGISTALIALKMGLDVYGRFLVILDFLVGSLYR